VAALEVANPRQTFVRRDPKTGRKFYTVVGPTGTSRDWDAQDVEHIWALEVPGHDRGLGPIQACRYALTGILDVRDYADSWFSTSAQDVPSGILKTDQRLDAESAKFYKEAWRNPDADVPEEQRRRGPQVRVLGQGLTYDPMVLKPSDAQWLESQAFGVLDVARMFGLPGDYLLAAVEGSSLTYSNLEMIDAQFLRTTLFPSYLRKIEAALSNVLPRGQEARFDASALLRPDAKTRAEIAAILIPLGVTTKEQVADQEGTTPGPATPAPTKAGVPA
jgi:HK97 family phage portal protein